MAKRITVKTITDTGYVDPETIKRSVPAFLVRERYDLERFAGEPAVFTLADSYFYRGKSTPESVADRLVHKLQEAGFTVELLASGDHCHEFVGGAATLSAKSSFMWAVVRVS